MKTARKSQSNDFFRDLGSNFPFENINTAQKRKPDFEYFPHNEIGFTGNK